MKRYAVMIGAASHPGLEEKTEYRFFEFDENAVVGKHIGNYIPDVDRFFFSIGEGLKHFDLDPSAMVNVLDSSGKPYIPPMWYADVKAQP